jgi:hypothetical protein
MVKRRLAKARSATCGSWEFTLDNRLLKLDLERDEVSNEPEPAAFFSFGIEKNEILRRNRQPITIASTYNASDPIAWRQMHHWARWPQGSSA